MNKKTALTTLLLGANLFVPQAQAGISGSSNYQGVQQTENSWTDLQSGCQRSFSPDQQSYLDKFKVPDEKAVCYDERFNHLDIAFLYASHISPEVANQYEGVDSLELEKLVRKGIFAVEANAHAGKSVDDVIKTVRKERRGEGELSECTRHFSSQAQEYLDKFNVPEEVAACFDHGLNYLDIAFLYVSHVSPAVANEYHVGFGSIDIELLVRKGIHAVEANLYVGQPVKEVIREVKKERK